MEIYAIIPKHSLKQFHREKRMVGNALILNADACFGWHEQRNINTMQFYLREQKLAFS